MPFDFEDVEGLEGLDSGEEEAEGQSAASDVVASLYEAPEEQEQDESSGLDAQMRAVEERLAVAQYYRLLLNDSMFSDGSPAAKRVEKEIRHFVRGRLEVLMGVRPEAVKVKAEDLFTEAEVKVLKQVASLALDRAQKAAVAAPAAPAPPPSLKRVETKEETRPQPKMERQKPTQPTLRQAQAPALRQPNQPPPRPAGARVPTPKVDDTRIPPQYKNDPTLQIKGEKVYVQARNAEGAPLWLGDPRTNKREPLLKDITLPAKPAPGTVQPLPSPIIAAGNADQFNMAMQAQGNSMLGLAERKASKMGIGSIFAGSVVSNLNPNASDGE